MCLKCTGYDTHVMIYQLPKDACGFINYIDLDKMVTYASKSYQLAGEMYNFAIYTEQED